MSGGKLAQPVPVPTWEPLLQAWAWPISALILVLAILAWLTFSTAAKPVLTVIFSRVRRVTAFGVEFDLTREAAVQTRTNVEAGFGELRRKLKRQFDALIDSEAINDKLAVLAENAVKPHLTTQAKKSYRCTIHIKDVLFEDALYQLLDYYPGGGGRGRARSVRSGIIGRCARLNQPDLQPDVTTNIEKLVESWAMTTGEAANVGRDRQSFAAVPLFDSDRQLLGIFYMDAIPQNAWKSAVTEAVEDHPLCGSVTAYATECGLLSSLSRVVTEMRRTGPRLRVFAGHE